MCHHNIDHLLLGLLDCEIGGDRVKESMMILELQPEDKRKETIFNCDDFAVFEIKRQRDYYFNSIVQISSSFLIIGRDKCAGVHT